MILTGLRMFFMLGENNSHSVRTNISKNGLLSLPFDAEP